MSDRYTEKYEEWRERVGIMPDQDVREAWEYQQEKIDELRALIDKLTAGQRLQKSSLWDTK